MDNVILADGDVNLADNHHPIESRERILEEAGRLFIEQGYHRLSMRRLAESVGISKAGIYHHFEDKETLFLAVLVDCLEALEEVILQVETASGSARDKIAMLVRLILGMPPRRRAMIRLSSQEMGQISPAARQSFNVIYHQKFIGRVAALLAQGTAVGEFKPIPAPTLTWALLGLMYPYFYSAHAGDIGATAETVEQLVDIFFNGIGAHGQV